MNFYTNVPLVRLEIFIKKNRQTLWISADGTHTRSSYLNDIRRYFEAKIIKIHRVKCRLKTCSVAWHDPTTPIIQTEKTEIS